MQAHSIRKYKHLSGSSTHSPLKSGIHFLHDLTYEQLVNFRATFTGSPITQNKRPERLKSSFLRSLKRNNFAHHCGFGIVPARPRKPRDKAKVESAVQVAQRWIVAALRHRKFFSLEELNQAIRELLHKLNHRPFRKKEGTRASAWEAVDKPALKPLPLEPFDVSQWSRARVDWAGATIPIHDRHTGQAWQASLFVAALGASSYTWAEATRDQQMEAWLACHAHAFEHFHGIPALAVPDNTKTGVTKAHRYDPDLNPTYYRRLCALAAAPHPAWRATSGTGNRIASSGSRPDSPRDTLPTAVRA